MVLVFSPWNCWVLFVVLFYPTSFMISMPAFCHFDRIPGEGGFVWLFVKRFHCSVTRLHGCGPNSRLKDRHRSIFLLAVGSTGEGLRAFWTWPTIPKVHLLASITSQYCHENFEVTIRLIQRFSNSPHNPTHFPENLPLNISEVIKAFTHGLGGTFSIQTIIEAMKL